MKSRGSIVLLTDFGLSDPYVGVMKGVIDGISSETKLIDLSHYVPPQNILVGARMLKDNRNYFPKGSIFLAVVDPGVGGSRKAIAIKSCGYYYVGPDNGLFGPIFEFDKRAIVRELVNKKYWRTQNPSSTFHGRDIFAPVAAHLSQSPQIFSSLGPVQTRIKQASFPKVTKSKGSIRGEISYFDSFGNAVTNIRYEDFLNFKNPSVKTGKHKIQKISSNYLDGKGLIALVSSSGYLEFSVFSGNAQTEKGLKVNQKVSVMAGVK